MAAGSGETARPASGKYVFGAHRPAAWQLTISLGKIPDLVPGGGDAATRGSRFLVGPLRLQAGAGRSASHASLAAHRHLRAPSCRDAAADPDLRRRCGFRDDKPRILHAGGRAVLHLPAYESGTGNFNRELLYVWANDAWHDELDRRLPKGLVILKGVYPDYEKMTAETPVWRRSHRGGQRWHRQGRRMRRSLAALSSAGLPAGRPKGTNAMTGSFHIEPWDAPPKS
ncbi:MAG TPA: hypothetical protein VGI94_19085 [Reyranella sp.]